MPIELFLAWRFLRDGRLQTGLIVIGASVGVAVMVFLSALMAGLSTSLVRQTLGTQAHVVVRPAEQVARALRPRSRDTLVVAAMERAPRRLRSIVDWPARQLEVASMPGVTAVAPSVVGAAFALRGTTRRSVTLLGVDARSFGRIYAVEAHLRSGRFGVSATGAVVGDALAADLGVRVSDRIRLQAAQSEPATLRVEGIFDLGNRDVNERWVLVSMRTGQTLLDLVGGASRLDVAVSEVFEAERVARRISDRTGLDAESWMARNGQLLVALSSQSASSVLIQFFVIVAVALGIASVLAVSVVQRGRQIGILRAMGAPRGRVVGVCLLQGVIVGLASSVTGTLLGAGLALAFSRQVENPDGSPTFPVELGPWLFVRAVAVATAVGWIAAVAPARRAARLDPVEAIRNE
jgi:lipoprotein-releasing system permease protein